MIRMFQTGCYHRLLSVAQVRMTAVKNFRRERSSTPPFNASPNGQPRMEPSLGTQLLSTKRCVSCCFDADVVVWHNYFRRTEPFMHHSYCSLRRTEPAPSFGKPHRKMKIPNTPGPKYEQPESIGQQPLSSHASAPTVRRLFHCTRGALLPPIRCHDCTSFSALHCA